MTMFSLFVSKKTLAADFFKVPKDNQWLAINFNEVPKHQEVDQIFNFTNGDQDYIIKSSLFNDRLEYSLSTEKGSKSYDFFDDFKVEHMKVDVFKEQLIQQKISQSIKLLETFTPSALTDEEKSWEWFRVSMDVLQRGVSQIDHQKTLLQYKLFWGTKNEHFTTRLVMYNLDICITFLRDGLEVKVYNDKPNEPPSHKPALSVIIKGHYNDFFNKYIELLRTVREVEHRLSL